MSKTTKPAATVDALLASLEHPQKEAITLVRGWILQCDPSIQEAVKWNAPSFRTTDFFATFHLRSQHAVELVFHTGAKAKASAVTGLGIEDPSQLVRWLAKDRGLVRLGNYDEVIAKRAAFEALVRSWIAAL